ncbi:MAG: MFS transporter [Nitrososphaerota archaeon]|jgi:MFS family permease|nr:MFS transporter [Nitrososphaerota archaeon]
MKQSWNLALIAFFAEVSLTTLSIYIPYRAYNLGANNETVGIIGGASSIVYVVMPFIMGRLSDRVGQKRMLIAGTLTVSILSAGYFLITNPVLFIPLRVVEGFGWSMVWPPLESLVSTSSEDPYRGLARFNIAWGVGAAFAPIFGGVIVLATSIRFTLAMSSLVALLGALFIGLTPAPHRAHIESQTIKFSQSSRRRIPLLPLYFSAMYGVTAQIVTTFYPRYATTLNFSVLEWGTVVSLFLLGRLVAFIFSENVRKRIGLQNMFWSFSAIAVIFPISAIFVGTFFALDSLTSFLTGACIGYIYSATISKMVVGPVEYRGRAAGMFESSIGLGTFLGPAVAGYVAVGGLSLTLALPALMMILAAMIGIAGRRKLGPEFPL